MRKQLFHIGAKSQAPAIGGTSFEHNEQPFEADVASIIRELSLYGYSLSAL